MSLKLCVGEKTRRKYRKILAVVMMVVGGWYFLFLFQTLCIAICHFCNEKIYESKNWLIPALFITVKS